MVHGIVSRHGGSVEVKSLEGHGTTVSMRFPIKSEEDDAEAAPANSTTAAPSRILVAEDEAPIRELLRQFLADEGHRVEIAVDGAEAWEFYQDGRFDLVITDHSMPKLCGEDLAKRIKSVTPDTPVLMLTGFGKLMNIIDNETSVADMILSKPIRLESLKAKIAAVLSHHLPESSA
jgi:DNA-binding response OmpR family regulator